MEVSKKKSDENSQGKELVRFRISGAKAVQPKVNAKKEENKRLGLVRQDTCYPDPEK